MGDADGCGESRKQPRAYAPPASCLSAMRSCGNFAAWSVRISFPPRRARFRAQNPPPPPVCRPVLQLIWGRGPGPRSSPPSREQALAGTAQGVGSDPWRNDGQPAEGFVCRRGILAALWELTQRPRSTAGVKQARGRERESGQSDDGVDSFGLFANSHCEQPEPPYDGCD